MKAESKSNAAVKESSSDKHAAMVADLYKLLEILKKQRTYMTLEEASEYIRRSTDYVRKRRDRIGYYKEGKDLTFKKSDIDKFMNDIYHPASQ